MNPQLDKQLIKDIIQWDVLNWSRSLNYWDNMSSIPKSQQISALEIGAREGGLSLFLALRGADCTCTDITNPERTATITHKKYKVNNKIQYKEADVCNLNFPDNKFDIVIFKSVLGALQSADRQNQAIKEIFRVLKVGGELWLAENLKASSLHQYLRSKYVRWSNEWRYIEAAELNRLVKSCRV